MQYSYPVDLTPDGEGWLATAPDFPELATDGDTPQAGLANAVGALTAVIGLYIDDGRDLPLPSAAAGRPTVALPLLIERALRLLGQEPALEVRAA